MSFKYGDKVRFVNLPPDKRGVRAKLGVDPDRVITIGQTYPAGDPDLGWWGKGGLICPLEFVAIPVD
jgi:hypothetical protein